MVVIMNGATPGTAVLAAAFGTLFGFPLAVTAGVTECCCSDCRRGNPVEGAEVALRIIASHVRTKWSFKALVTGTIPPSAISTCSLLVSTFFVTDEGTWDGGAWPPYRSLLALLFHACDRDRIPPTARTTLSSASFKGLQQSIRRFSVYVAGGILSVCRQRKHQAIHLKASIVVSTSTTSNIPNMRAASNALRIP